MNHATKMAMLGSLATKSHRAIVQGNIEVARQAVSVLDSAANMHDSYEVQLEQITQMFDANSWLSALQPLAELAEYCHSQAAESRQQKQPPKQQLPRGATDGRQV